MKNIYLSKNANKLLIDYFHEKGWRINIIEGVIDMDFAIRTHPDIYMCKLGISKESPIFFGATSKLGKSYPYDIIYNAACTGKYFIHNLHYTDKELMRVAEDFGFLPVNIRQGYSKCSLAIVDEDSVITSDEGSAKVLRTKGLNVLLIKKGHIKLNPYEYGFIGGCCARIGNEMVFNGNLSAHPDFEAIEEFIESRGLSLKYFEEYELEDIGSILCSTAQNIPTSQNTDYYRLYK